VRDKEEKVESKNRTAWIIVAVILIIACCCATAFAAVALGWIANRAVDLEPFDLGGPYRERSEQTLEVGDAPTLRIDNFAGSVTIRAGDSSTIHVVATKKASRRSRLDRIQIEISERDGGAVIQTKKPTTLNNVSVDLEITAPAGTRLDLSTGAGTLDVRDITGQIDAHSGAGTIEVRGAQGIARLDLGAGQIIYEGAPAGECRFHTGAGEIVLRLPADLNAEVDLSTGIGSVNVDYRVDGQVSTSQVRGVIGDGSQGSIYAHTGAGSIEVYRR
jgi:hypothetical protein